MEDLKHIGTADGVSEVTEIRGCPIAIFRGNYDALGIWLEAMNQKDTFIFRVDWFKNNILKCGRRRWKKAIDLLKAEGLIKLICKHDENGAIISSEYKVFDFVEASKQVNFGEKESGLCNFDITKRGNTRGIQKVGLVSAFSMKTQRKVLSSKTLLETIPVLPVKEMKQKTLVLEKPEDRTRAFLKMFPGCNTYQTFDDKKTTNRMNKVFTGNKYIPQLRALNQRGAGVFLTINETDGKGRCTENITKVRAVFVDLDGSPIEPVIAFGPHMVIESSPGRYHAYWLVEDVPLSEFKGIQKRIAYLFDGDPSVCDLPRVMRVPGFLWNKRDIPYLTDIISVRLEEPKFIYEEIDLMFPALKPIKVEKPALQIRKINKPVPGKRSSVVSGARRGERNDRLMDLVVHLKRRGEKWEDIVAAAYEFGRRCNPPLSDIRVDRALNWTERKVS